MTSRIILRFGINQGNRTYANEPGKKFQRAYQMLMPGVLAEYAEKQYPKIAASLHKQVKRDVEREITNLAQMYKNMIFNAPLGGTGPRNTVMTSAAYDGPRAMAGAGNGQVQSIGGGLPQWPKRSAKYMATAAKRASPGWFRRLGDMRDKMAKGATWREMFGPVLVTIQRTRNASAMSDAGAAVRGAAENTLGGAQTSGYRVGLLQVKVSAMGRVTGAMLRNYSSRSGLIGLVFQRDPQLAYRLGGPSPAKHRPTMQPFLEFFLTKAMGHAVQRRVVAGVKADIREA